MVELYSNCRILVTCSCGSNPCEFSPRYSTGSCSSCWIYCYKTGMLCVVLLIQNSWFSFIYLQVGQKLRFCIIVYLGKKAICGEHPFWNHRRGNDGLLQPTNAFVWSCTSTWKSYFSLPSESGQKFCFSRGKNYSINQYALEYLVLGLD